MPKPQPSDLISTAEAAEILGLDVSTIARWVQLGKLVPAMQLPGKTGSRLFVRSYCVAKAAELAASAR